MVNTFILLLKTEVPPPMALVILQIVGHCDGIICRSTHELAALYNPSKEFNFLPKSCLLPPPNVAYGYNVGFGYDSKAKDYKVVRIACSISHSDHPPNRGEVYTLSSNSWSEIKTNFNTLLYSTPGSGLYFKRVYYWYAFKQELEHHKESIVSFDMSEELFHHTSLPDHLSVTKGCHNHLVALKESIALLSHNRCEVAKTFEVWGMEGFGAGKELCIKYFSVGPLEGIEYPLIFWESDEFLAGTYDLSAVSYNVCTQTFNYLPIHGAEEGDLQAVVYVNSIVSVNPRQQ
ncbi:PREDICTED: F-box/kelch-repeat protein At3g06240-like [Fragaria vesca subsp. vesca]|uniref:F-box/kelch-repeat protein At3g06240-like n=1 Tax=Fragaria vesca subsp. vesca TaxID=101020 RepID=UPI0002C2F50A|nr:PREDICTED: F-box/kelch-repeat protein At3g06240-like [Fragaria vesca subsp. vesca]